MPNVLNAQGLTLATQEELLSILTAGMQAIYGADINLASDSPDGQLLNLFLQMILDVQDLLNQVYNGFDPDNAVGNVLDQRVAINGIQRQGGTYTITPITLVNSSTINLFGLDQTAEPAYTISDSSGNLWNLQTSQTGLSAGTHILSFRSAVPGAITTTLDTINIQVTVVLGITSVNNPTTYTTLGTNQESDATLKLRRARSVSLASQGYLAGLYAALANVNGVTSTFIYENFTDSVDSDGVPGHSIWVIVSGSGAAEDIAGAIYAKRNAGCGMFGEQSYTITQIDGTAFVVNWDNVEFVNLFISFTATSINGITAPAVGVIDDTLPTIYMPQVNEEVNINGLATLVQQIDSNTLVTNAGFSDGSTQIFTLSGIAASGTFKINYNGDESDPINWDDTNTQIQTNLRTNVTGLTTVVVTGSIASGTLTFDLTSLTSIAALLYVTDNSLQTSAPADVNFSYDEGYTNTLSPRSKKYQFVVSSENIIILDILLLPSSPTISPLGEIAFQSYGGYGVYAYALTVNNSGGSIDAITGEYTAGSTPLVTDTVQVTDSFGNTKTVNVTIT